MIDIHTHFMYEVDDGSSNLEMTKELLKISSSQGVKTIFLTPHVYSLSETAKFSEYNEKFMKISKIAKSFGINCFLGAEIYISFRIPEIDFNKFSMGNSKVLLIEFSTILKTPILEHSYNLIKKGFKIIIAHVERYQYLSIEDIYNLKKMGIYIQVNASSFIKKGKSKHLTLAWKYLENDLVDFVASDSHNLTSRPPNLKMAYDIIEKKIGTKKVNDLFFKNASKILLN